MSRAQTERGLACDALREVGPDADTLCDGWTAHQLAAHLWIRENEFINMLGFAVSALADRTNARMARLQAQLSFAELVHQIRKGPPRFSLFGLADEGLNAMEYLIHGLDVRRPAPTSRPGRDPGFDDWAWSRVKPMAEFMIRRPPVGLVFERAGRSDDVVRVGAGDRIVTGVGAPVELLLYIWGRRDAAEVELVGVESAIEALNQR